MLATFLETFAQMFRILFYLFIGYMFNKRHLVPRTAEPVLSKFVALLFIPSLTFYSNMAECRIDSLGLYSRYVLAGGALWLLFAVLGCIFAKLFAGKDTYIEGIYRYAFAFPNTGGVGTPLVLAFFGTAGLFQSGLFLLVPGIMTYAWGVQQLWPVRKKITLRTFLQNFFNINFIAMISGMLLGVLGAKEWMPAIVMEIFSDLGGCYVPVALLLTGYTIADYQFREIFGHIRVYLYTVLRLVVFPCIALGILYLCKAPQMMIVLTALSFSCPSGMNVVVFPAAYGQDCREGASLILISSLCSLFTIPVIYALAQQFFI